MKNKGKLFLATLVMMIFAVQAKAQNTSTTNQPDQQQNTVTSTYGKFVDKDSNGVCDNFESRSGNKRGDNFVDKNNDGICDNRANVGKKTGNNCRNGKGNQYRNGQCRGQGRGNCCRR